MCMMEGMQGKPGMHGMGMEHGLKPALLMMMWEKLDEKSRKMLVMRMLDEKIMMKENFVRHMQHKIETYKMVKQMLDNAL